jgi:hypothetical protein
MIGWFINNEYESIGKERAMAHFKVTFPEFACRDWIKANNTSVRVSGLRNKIWIQGLRMWSRPTKGANHSTAIFALKDILYLKLINIFGQVTKIE